MDGWMDGQILTDRCKCMNGWVDGWIDGLL